MTDLEIATGKSMLYCPKCSSAYVEGTQRFCTRDGARLLSSDKSPVGQSVSVFTNLLKKAETPAENGSKSGLGRVLAEIKENQSSNQTTNIAFAESPENNLAARIKDLPPPAPESAEEALPAAKTPPRLIRLDEIAVSQAKLGDRKVNPTGRLALSWANTAILLGQTVKGRYYIVEQLSEDETSVAYLAEDKLSARRSVVVRVLMDETTATDDYSRKIFAEERVSLSHINHPNIAALIDSGELLEGKSFIVSEYVAGETLKEKLQTSGTFSTHRAARIIKQAANALSEAHQNGVLHRKLTARNIVLTVSNSGNEQVKVTDFAVFDGMDSPNDETVKYLSPEQLEGRLPNVASDIYSLAVIAFQILTGRFPFNFSNEKELLRAQKEGLTLCPTNLRLDLPSAVDEVLEKALTYKPSERYTKAREFGDAFFNALATYGDRTVSAEPFTKENTFQLPKSDYSALLPSSNKENPTSAETEESELEQNRIEPVSEEKITESDASKMQNEAVNQFAQEKDNHFEETEMTPPPEAEKQTGDLPWEKRSPDAGRAAATASRSIFLILGALLLAVAGALIWNYLLRRAADPPSVVVQTSRQSAQAGGVSPINPGVANSDESKSSNDESSVDEPNAPEVESPPLPRQILQPPNTIYFQNTKENLKGDLAKNFRGFSFFYPNDWTKAPASQTHFVDVARIGATGTPIEQFLVSYYDSRGTFAADQEKFPKLVDQSNKDLMKSLGDSYKFLYQGETKINGEWKAYEMKFQAEGTTKNGDKVTLWGRRLWLPAARQGIRTGFIITMLATSLSPEIKSADDVGVKGELATVLQTFEPAALDAAY